MKRIGLGVLALVSTVLTGCLSTGTGILPAGPDTYTTEETFLRVAGGSEAAERSVLTKADAYCKQKGQQFAPLTMAKTGPPNDEAPRSGYTVTFKCLSPNDPSLASYRLQPGPDLVIEQRNR